MRILSNFNRGVTQRRNPRSPFVRRNCLSSLSTQTRSSFSSGSHSPTLVSPLSKYNAMVEAGDIVQDQRQLAILSRFETLFDQLHDINNANTGKKGLYLYGGVGIGKTMLMDLFYTCLAPEKQKFATRKHFHQFMLDVHQRIHVWKQEHPKRGDPLPSVGRMIGEDSSLICFDEVAITDVADALILRRLFEATLDTGAVLVATSNRPPEDLYKGGINRHVFLPFIDLLHEHCHVIDLDRMAAELLDYDVTDYRQLTRPVEGVFNHPGSVEKEQEKGQGQLSQPQVLTQGERSERMRANMNHWYTAAVRGGNNDSGDGIKTHAGTKTSEKASLQGGLLEYDTHTVPLSLPVLMNRTLEVRRASPCGRVGVFSFDELCDQALGSADYTALCRQFKMVLLEDIPR